MSTMLIFKFHFLIRAQSGKQNEMNSGGKSIFKSFSGNQMVCCKFSRHAQVVQMNLVRRDHYQT